MSLLEKIELEEAYQQYNPTLLDLNRFFDDNDFIGDEETRLGLCIALIRRKPCGVVSGAGTGKSLVVDTALKLFDKNSIYVMEAGSEKAQLAKKDEINSASILYLSEIQKAGKSDVVVELLKNLGEGKNYNYSRTKLGSHNETEEISIESGKSLIYTKAIENEYDTDDELNRRFTRFTTDMSQPQNEKVNKSKAHRRTNPLRNKILKEEELNSLKCHMRELMKEDANTYTYINPLADFLVEYIPSTFAVSRSFTDHYFDLIEGVAFFNKRNRITDTIEHNGETKRLLFVAPEDCWQLLRIYQKQFMQEVLNIPPNGIHIFEVFEKAEEKGLKSKNTGFDITQGLKEKSKTALTKEQISSLLKDKGIVLKNNLLQKLLLDLIMSGYLVEEEIQTANKKIKEYSLTNDAVSFQQIIDWELAVQKAIETMKEEFPDHAIQYEQQYCINPVFTDPFGTENFEVNNLVQEFDDRDLWTND